MPIAPPLTGSACEHTQHCPVRILDCFTKLAALHAAVSRDNWPLRIGVHWIVAASGTPFRLLSSPNRFRRNSKTKLSNQKPSSLARTGGGSS
jgi:hypothetical protein